MVSDDRAQLLLVGSIAIGIVLIGMTIVLNSAVFTENVADSNPVEVTGDVAEFDREATRSVRGLALRVNHVTAYDHHMGAGGVSALRDDLRENVTTYSRAVGESYADTGSVYVNVTFEGVGETGTRIAQVEDGDFTDPTGGGADWTVFDDPFQLGWFVTNLKVENVSRTDPFRVSVRNASGAEWHVSTWRTNTGDLAINASSTAGSVPDTTCTPTNGRVVVDLVRGETNTDDCSFNGTSTVEPPYSELDIVDGDEAGGKLDIVANDTTGAGVTPCVTPHDMCEAAAAWSVEFSVEYKTGKIAYDRSHNVSVYDP